MPFLGTAGSALTNRDNQWQRVGALSQPLGYGVSIQGNDKVILVGGETTDGVATSAVTQMTWQGNKLHME